MDHQELMAACGLGEIDLTNGTLAVYTPIDGTKIAQVKVHGAADVEAIIGARRPGLPGVA